MNRLHSVHATHVRATLRRIPCCGRWRCARSGRCLARRWRCTVCYGHWCWRTSASRTSPGPRSSQSYRPPRFIFRSGASNGYRSSLSNVRRLDSPISPRCDAGVHLLMQILLVSALCMAVGTAARLCCADYIRPPASVFCLRVDDRFHLRVADRHDRLSQSLLSRQHLLRALRLPTAQHYTRTRQLALSFDDTACVSRRS